MEKVSNYISKKVISMQDGNIVGYVLDVLFDDDFTRCEGLIIVDEESENTFVLYKNHIKSVGEDCIIIDSANDLDINITNQSLNPIGKMVYDKNGVVLGRVKDILISSFFIKKIITNKCEIPLKYICKVGKDCVIFGKKITQKSKTNFKVNKSNLPKVYIQGQSDDIIIENNLNKTMKYDSVTHTKPLRLFANINSLIGKEVKMDIMGYNNEIIIRKYDKITQSVINKAKLHNKLNLLFIYGE